MPIYKNKLFLYVKRPGTDVVTSEHYKLVEEDFNVDLKDGEVLYRAKYLSVDPYMRIQQAASNTWEAPHPLNVVQGGGCVGIVVESKHANFQPGDFVSNYSGWQLYVVVAGDKCKKITTSTSVSPSTALGIMGMPGRTAYFGLMEAGKPKAGDVCVVSGAAGAVGSLVIQIAKIHGCVTIGFAGKVEKVAYLKSIGVDYVLNYKDYKSAEAVRIALRQTIDDGVKVGKISKGEGERGIDIYFDNTGGPVTDAVMALIALRARVIICGAIDQYNGGLDNPPLGPKFLHRLIYTRATIQGVLARDYTDRQDELNRQMQEWITQNKIQYKETIIKGFKKLPEALNGLFIGSNTGKMIVEVEE